MMFAAYGVRKQHKGNQATWVFQHRTAHNVVVQHLSLSIEYSCLVTGFEGLKLVFVEQHSARLKGIFRRLELAERVADQ